MVSVLPTLLSLLVAPVQAKLNGTMEVDVVALIAQGKKITGDAKVSVDHQGYRYLFANETDRQAFLSDPARYEIQLGGGCGKMGPLSGLGSTTIYAVYKDRVYIFASDSCRQSFLANPEVLIDRDDEAPAGTPEEAAAARAALDKATAWVGASKGLAGIKEFEQVTVNRSVSGGQEWVNTVTVTYTLPDGLRRKDQWNDNWWADEIAHGAGQFTARDGERRPMADAQVRAMERLRNCTLLAVLTSRARPDFVAFAGPAQGGTQVIRTHFDGSLVELEIESETGKPLRLGYTGRGPGSVIGRIDRMYTAFSESEGVRLPTAWTGRFNGQAVDSMARSDVKVKVVRA